MRTRSIAAVAQPDQMRHARGEQHAAAGGTGRPKPIDDHPDMRQLFPRYGQCIRERRQQDDGRAMLIIMHHRYGQRLS